MATLVLSSLGTLIGGPLGGAIGALVGSQVDGQIFGTGSSEGARLEELSVTTSSYGTPLPRHHGRMRAAGTIIWATDLIENRETSGGKGKPSTTTYSYTMSFAVALASRPIHSVGRIWADGNLLRGAAGDLKVGGTFRLYQGLGDQPLDPLIAAAEGTRCPAFRNRAYCVFEDLELADFGNRIPALTFEIIADDGTEDGTISLSQLIQQVESAHDANVPLTNLEGFSYQGGALVNMLTTIDSLYPLVGDAGEDRLSLKAADLYGADPIMLPPAASAWDENDFGGASGQTRNRDGRDDDTPQSVRYYDVDRDFQPGIQRADGRARVGRTRTIEFPGAMTANNARTLANTASQRATWVRESLSWRVAELDPAIMPGTFVQAPGIIGIWRVSGWEWREKGVELELVRLPPIAGAAPAGDSGTATGSADVLAYPTTLRAFEVPWDGSGSGDSPIMFAAASSSSNDWSGAALYLDNAGALEALGTTGRTLSVTGYLTTILPPSEAVLLEKGAAIEIELGSSDLSLGSTTTAGMSGGANRILIGGEVVQFTKADQVSATNWKLSGLLRGRGGTELAAQMGHVAGTSATLLDDSLVPLDPASVTSSSSTVLAAIGQADESPVYAPLENAGITRRPLAPVHPRISWGEDGGLTLCWTRRARGAWQWPDEVEAPLVEQTERYRVGIGSISAPVAVWETDEPTLILDGSSIGPLGIANPGAPVWVRQIGSYAQSNALLLATLT